jgi:hypothetical protein
VRVIRTAPDRFREKEVAKSEVVSRLTQVDEPLWFASIARMPGEVDLRVLSAALALNPRMRSGAVRCVCKGWTLASSANS